MNLSNRIMGLLFIALLVMGCGKDAQQGSGDSLRIHAVQFRMPFGQSRLLTYDYPDMELISEFTLGKISTRMTTRPGSNEIWIGSETSQDIIIYDSALDSILNRVNVGVPIGGLAFDTSGKRCLVSHGAVLARDKSQPNATLLDADSRKPMKAFRVGESPRGVCFDADSLRAFVANTGGNTVSLLNMTLGFTEDSLVVGDAPQDLALDPVGRWLYVACLGTSTPEGRDPGELQVYSLPELTLVASIEAGAHPSRVNCSPDGEFIVVSDLWIRAGDEPRVRVFSVASDERGLPVFELRHEIDAGDNPLSGSLSQDGRHFLVSDFANCRVALLDVKKGKRLRWLQLPGIASERFCVDALFSQQ